MEEIGIVLTAEKVIVSILFRYRAYSQSIGTYNLSLGAYYILDLIGYILLLFYDWEAFLMVILICSR